MCTITITNLSASVNTKHLNWFTEVTCSILCTIPFDKLFNRKERTYLKGKNFENAEEASGSAV